MELPDTITCIECGGVAHLTSHPAPDDPVLPGDIVTYACEACHHRMDVVWDDE